jgi:hypothetical protein
MVGVIEGLIEAEEVELLRDGYAKVVSVLKKNPSTYWMLAAKIYIEFLKFNSEIEQQEF